MLSYFVKQVDFARKRLSRPLQYSLRSSLVLAFAGIMSRDISLYAATLFVYPMGSPYIPSLPSPFSS